MNFKESINYYTILKEKQFYYGDFDKNHTLTKVILN